MSKRTVELKKMDAKQLQARVAELRAQLVEQKRARAAGESPNPMAVRKTRREIAVCLTLLVQANQLAVESKETK